MIKLKSQDSIAIETERDGMYLSTIDGYTMDNTVIRLEIDEIESLINSLIAVLAELKAFNNIK